MVKITNITDRTLYRRTPRGTVLSWDAGETRDVESKRLIEELKASNGFKVTGGVNKKDVGAGVKTGVRRPKSNRKPNKSKVQEKVDKLAKGLKKSKAKKGKAD
jgi:hypothetical protein